jgi:hypothetical protein
MTYIKGWKCDSCGTISPEEPWNCPSCGKEVCESCLDRFMLCKDCSKGKTSLECKEIAIKAGYFDREEFEE